MSTQGTLVLDTQTPTFLDGILIGSPPSLAQTRLGQGYGEVVFNTSMTGYQEILTDPSYRGQILCFTSPHVGNYGIHLSDSESPRAWCSGVLVHELTPSRSHWRSQLQLSDWLLEQGLPGLTQIDTRALTRLLRTQGVVRGMIVRKDDSDQALALMKELPAPESRDLIAEVSTRQAYVFSAGSGPRSPKIVAIDFGIKANLLRLLARQGCEVRVLPAYSSAQAILEQEPDGIFLSNGPGDPEKATAAIVAVRDLLGKVPLFGVCMGHQVLSLALGARTYKLKFGHRGGNQPVIEHRTGKVEISSHNHGFAVDPKSLPSQAIVSHTNLNDGCVEGIEIPSLKAFSVQYHPEACPGPHDSVFLIDRFIQQVREAKDAKARGL